MDTPVADPKALVTFRLARLQNRLNAQAMRLLKLHSAFSLTEYRISVMMSRRSVTTLSQLAQDTELDKGQISRAVKALADRGFVISETDELDHRQHNLRLTKQGIAELRTLTPIMTERREALTASFSQDEMTNFFGLLDKLEEAAFADA